MQRLIISKPYRWRYLAHRTKFMENALRRHFSSSTYTSDLKTFTWFPSSVNSSLTTWKNIFTDAKAVYYIFPETGSFFLHFGPKYARCMDVTGNDLLCPCESRGFDRVLYILRATRQNFICVRISRSVALKCRHEKRGDWCLFARSSAN